MGLLDTTDPLWPRVVAAFASHTPKPEGLTDDEIATAKIMEYVKGVVMAYESAPKPVDVKAACDKVDADFAGLIPKPKPKVEVEQKELEE